MPTVIGLAGNICPFSLNAILVLYMCGFTCRAQGSTSVAIQSPPAVEVTVLDLLEHPEQYNNCQVRLRGLYRSGHGESYHCAKGKTRGVWLDFEDDVPSVEKEYRKWRILDFFRLNASGELQQEAAKLDWLYPLPIKPLPAEERRALHRALEKTKRVAGVIVVGRFDYAEAGRLKYMPGGGLGFAEGYGHFNSHMRIVAEHIEIRDAKDGRGAL